jgi:FKBP-type peptidyl-prolyl cis-trans isomerase (trigger factor)
MPKELSKITSTVAKEADGTVQITLTLPYSVIKDAEEGVLKEIGAEATLPGFRKGKAPVSKVKESLTKETLIKKILGKILGKAISDATIEHKIKPAIYPRLEVLKAQDDEPWEVRATTCELPKVNLGNYKEIVSGVAKTKAIWTPGKDKKEAPKELSHEEKEQLVIKTLLETIKPEIPRILIEEEVENRLAQLLDKIDKLGLTIEGYLGSLGKTIDTLRGEYQLQAKNTIALELILEEIARDAKTEINDKQIDAVVEAAKADPSMKDRLNSPEQRRVIASVLRRRASLDSLTVLL